MSLASRTSPAPKTAITKVRVFNGYSLSPPQTVVIADGLIASISSSSSTSDDLTEDVTLIDGTDLTLLPGLIESHSHPKEASHLRAYLKSGITTVLEMGSGAADVVQALKAVPSLPTLYTAGTPATAPWSTHARMLKLPASEMPSTPSEAVRFVGARIARGVDYIKAVSDTPGMDQATLNTVVSQARQNDLKSQVHASRHAAYVMAVKARPTVVHHVPLDKQLGESDDLGGKDFAACPTLVAMKAINIGFQGNLPQQLENAMKSVGVLRDAGVPILAGSDANTAKVKGLPEVKFGEALHEELALLKEAGLSNVEVLRSATAVPAKVFELRDRGAVREGLRADLILVEGDPTEDLESVGRVKSVWLGGVRYLPEEIQVK